MGTVWNHRHTTDNQDLADIDVIRSETVPLQHIVHGDAMLLGNPGERIPSDNGVPMLFICIKETTAHPEADE